MNTKKLRTPLIKPRQQGGTFYTFGSALEDIGLNVNELNNKVVLSHYVLLDLPDFNATTLNTFSDYANQGDKAGDYIFAESFQNYVLNMETAVRNHPRYDFSNSASVSERIFWKWLKNQMDLVEETGKNGAIRYIDNNHIAKCFGYINSGAQRTDDYSMYNETFVQIPSSFGLMKILYKVTEDDNYYAVNTYETTNKDPETEIPTGYIENITDSEIEDEFIERTGICALGIFDDPSTYTYNVDSSTDLLSVDFDLDSLRDYYNEETLTYDTLAIENGDEEKPYYMPNGDTFNFNAALIYYSIYDSTNKNILATNAYGLLLFNSSERGIDDDAESVIGELIGEEEPLYQFEPLVKKKTTATKSGTSYSFRLNIKASSVYSGDIEILDNSSPAYSMSTDFNDTVKNLNTAINILKSNTNLIASIDSDYKTLKGLTIQAIEKAADAYKEVTELKNGKFKNLDSSVLHTDTLSIGQGILFKEGGGLSIVDDNPALAINVIKSEISASDEAYNKVIHTDKFIVSDNGIAFTDNEDEEELVKINQKGVNTKNILISGDRTAGTPIDDATIASALNYIHIYFDNGEFSIVVNNGAPEPVGEILAALYDEESKKLNTKGLLALMLAKIKSI